MLQKKTPSRYKNAVIAHIMVKDASGAIEFYKRVFNAIEIFRIQKANGHIIHAEISIEDSVIMIGDAEEPFQEPLELKGTTVGLHVYVSDVDAVFKHAVAEGALIIQNLNDMFYGDRMGMIKDPFGHVWVLLTSQKNLTTQQIIDNAAVLLKDS